MIRATDTTSVTEHQAHLRQHFSQIRQSGRPLFVTANGRAEAVVLSPEAFDRLTERAELAENLAAVDRGLADLTEGRTRELREAVTSIIRDLGESDRVSRS